jgi:hypothetical protein
MIKWFLQLFCVHEWTFKYLRDDKVISECIACGKESSRKLFTK